MIRYIVVTGEDMQKIIYLVLAVGLYSYSSAMDVQEHKQLIITNKSGDSLELHVGVDGKKRPLEFRLAGDQQEVIPFKKSIDLIEIMARKAFITRGVLGIASYNYGPKAQETFLEEKKNIEVVINPAGYFAPYQVKIYSVKGSIKAEPGGIIPASKRVRDVFPQIDERIGDAPEVEIVLADIFGLSRDASYPTYLDRYEHLKKKWTKVKQEALDNETADFAGQVLETLNLAFGLLLEDRYFRMRGERRGLKEKAVEAFLDAFLDEHPVGKMIMLPAKLFNPQDPKDIERRNLRLIKLLK